jgi:voltage-gated potassium channel
MSEQHSNGSERIGLFQVVVLILSIIVLGALGVDTVFKLPKEVSDILQTFDTLVCMLLLADFGMRFYKAESKLGFLKWGWIDLLASIPNVPFLRVGRLIRILRVIRLLRAIRATQRVSSMLLKNKLHTGVTSVILTSFLLVTFCSIGILICEQQDPNANIKTAGDAFWWSVSTITTVGYGDVYPVTPEGRILAMVLMVSGIGLFGILSGLAASFFLGQHKSHAVQEQNQILARLEKIEEKIDQLKRSQ